MTASPPRLQHLELAAAPAVDRELCDEIDRRTEWLARRYEIIGHRSGAMSLERYRRGVFGRLTALAYPGADLDELVICNDFNTYLFYVDDQAEEDENYGKRPELLEAYFRGHVHALRTGDAPWVEDPGTRLLLSLRARLIRRVSTDWLDRFADQVQAYLLRGTLVGARHWTAGSVPEPAAYMRQRAFDSAVYCSQALAELTGGELDAETRADPAFERTRDLVTRVVAFTNDLVSYPKEVQRHRSPNNLVHVLMVHEGLELDAALRRVIELVNGDLGTFHDTADTLARRRPHPALSHYQSTQRAWMSANLAWSLQSGRYLDPHSPFVELRSADPAQAAG